MVVIHDLPLVRKIGLHRLFPSGILSSSMTLVLFLVALGISLFANVVSADGDGKVVDNMSREFLRILGGGTNWTFVSGALIVAVGLISAFFGKKCYKLVMILIMIVICCLLSLMIGNQMINEEKYDSESRRKLVLTFLATGASVGVVLGAIIGCMLRLGLAICGGLSGYLVSAFAIENYFDYIGTTLKLTISCVVAVVCIAIVFVKSDFAIMQVTALLGAIATRVGIDFLQGGMPMFIGHLISNDKYKQVSGSSGDDLKSYASSLFSNDWGSIDEYSIAIVAAVYVAGITVQLLTHMRSKRKRRDQFV